MITNQIATTCFQRWSRYACKRLFGTLESTKEFFDSQEEVKRISREVADKLKRSSHAIAFCGAGLSTSSGIPDYRSGYETVLETGPGKWETEENKAKYKNKPKIRRGNDAWPSKGHRALASLVNNGFIKFIISQNVDGLIQRTGVPTSKVCDLHGNIFREDCLCGDRAYWKDFVIPEWGDTKHKTGRFCDCSDGDRRTKDTIVYFGESLNMSHLELCSSHVHHSDFCLVVGSSMKVSPASSYINYFIKKKPSGSLAIVNLQKTGFHGKGAIEVHGMCDEVLANIVENLGIEMHSDEIVRDMIIRTEPCGTGKKGREIWVEFRDYEDKVIDAASSVRFYSSTTPTEGKILSKWPHYAFVDEGVSPYDRADVSFHFLPPSSSSSATSKNGITLDLPSEILSPSHTNSTTIRVRFTFTYDTSINYKSYAIL